MPQFLTEEDFADSKVEPASQILTDADFADNAPEAIKPKRAFKIEPSTMKSSVGASDNDPAQLVGSDPVGDLGIKDARTQDASSRLSYKDQLVSKLNYIRDNSKQKDAHDIGEGIQVADALKEVNSTAFNNADMTAMKPFIDAIETSYKSVADKRGILKVGSDAFKRGYVSTGSQLAQAGLALKSPNVSEADKEQLQNLQQVSSDYETRNAPKAVGGLKDVMAGDGVGDKASRFLRFGVESISENIPRMAGAIAGGIAGGIVAGPVGAGVGAGMAGFGQNLGEAVSDQVGEGQDLNVGLALGQAAGYSAIDSVLSVEKIAGGVISQAFKKSATSAGRKAFMGTAKDVVKSGLKAGVAEGFNEPMQSQIVGRMRRFLQTGTGYRQGEDLTGAMWEAADEAAGGFMSGMGLGGGASSIKYARDNSEATTARKNKYLNNIVTSTGNSMNDLDKFDSLAVMQAINSQVESTHLDTEGVASSLGMSPAQKLQAQAQLMNVQKEAVAGMSDKAKVIWNASHDVLATDFSMKDVDKTKPSSFNVQNVIDTLEDVGDGNQMGFDKNAGIGMANGADGMIAVYNQNGLKMPADANPIFNNLQDATKFAEDLARYNEQRLQKLDPKFKLITQIAQASSPGSNVRIVDTPAQLPAKVKADYVKNLTETGTPGQAMYDAKTDTVYILHGNIQTLGDAIVNVNHEAIHSELQDMRNSGDKNMPENIDAVEESFVSAFENRTQDPSSWEKAKRNITIATQNVLNKAGLKLSFAQNDLAEAFIDRVRNRMKGDGQTVGKLEMPADVAKVKGTADEGVIGQFMSAQKGKLDEKARQALIEEQDAMNEVVEPEQVEDTATPYVDTPPKPLPSPEAVSMKLERRKNLTGQDVEVLSGFNVHGKDLFNYGYRKWKGTDAWRFVGNKPTPPTDGTKKTVAPIAPVQEPVIPKAQEQVETPVVQEAPQNAPQSLPSTAVTSTLPKATEQAQASNGMTVEEGKRYLAERGLETMVPGGFESIRRMQQGEKVGAPIASKSVKKDSAVSEQESNPLKNFNEYVKSALGWQGARMNEEKRLMSLGDKKGAMKLAMNSGKTILDDFLMDKFGIDRDMAHQVSNHITAMDLRPDMTADYADYADAEQAQVTPEPVPAVADAKAVEKPAPVAPVSQKTDKQIADEVRQEFAPFIKPDLTVEQKQGLEKQFQKRYYEKIAERDAQAVKAKPVSKKKLGMKAVETAPVKEAVKTDKPDESLIAPEINRLLHAPSKAGGKPRWSFSTKQEERDFISGFRSAVDGGKEPQYQSNNGIAQKYQDARHNGWSSGMTWLRQLASDKQQEAVKPVEAVKVEQTSAVEKTVSVPSKDKPFVPAKEQKKWLLTEIDKAIEEAPETGEKDSEKITFEVPGDGVFTVFNEKTYLKSFKERISKSFPSTDATQASTPSVSVPRGTNASKVLARPAFEGNDKGAVKILEPFKSEGENRFALERTFYNPIAGEIVATDGRVLAVIQTSKTAVPEGTDIFKINNGSLQYPNYTQVIMSVDDNLKPGALPNPKDRPSVVVNDTEALSRKLIQANSINAGGTDKKSVPRAFLFVSKDGRVEIEAETSSPNLFGVFDEYKSTKGDETEVGMFNPKQLLDAVSFLRTLGNESITIHYKDEKSPLLLKGAKEYVIVMPLKKADKQREQMTVKDARAKAEADAKASAEASTPEAMKAREDARQNDLRIGVLKTLKELNFELSRLAGPSQNRLRNNIVFQWSGQRLPAQKTGINYVRDMIYEAVPFTKEDNTIASKEATFKKWAQEQLDASAADNGDGKTKFRKKESNIDRERIAELGYTIDLKEAGYITPEGKLIDLSGKKEGGQAGTRSYDHREAGGTKGMQEFMNEGNIRMDYDSGSVDIVKMPTDEQLSIIARLANLSDGWFAIDLDRGLGKEGDSYYEPTRGNTSVTYPSSTKPSKIIGDIRRYFNGENLGSGTRFRKKAVTPEQDKAYLDAIARGDMQTAQKMVDEAAKRAGYNVGPVYHGTDNPTFTEFDGDVIHFGTAQAAEEIMAHRGGREIGYNVEKFDDGFWVFADRDYKDIRTNDGIGPFKTERLAQQHIKTLPSEIPLYRVFLKIDNPAYDIDAGGTGSWRRSKDRASEKAGHDGIVYENQVEDAGSTSYAVFSPSQIKDASAITYDDQGNIIPLSQRFNEESSDIRFRKLQTDTTQFKAFFKDSKVVDADGKPLVVYHGTDAKRSVFDFQKLGRVSGRGTGTDWGFFFAEDRGHAEYWANMAGGDKVVEEVYLRLENPLVLDNVPNDGGASLEAMLNEGLRDSNHDGAIIRGVRDDDTGTPRTIYLVLEPSQIKSATANVGTFDPANPDIRYRKGSIPAQSADNRYIRAYTSTVPEARALQAEVEEAYSDGLVKVTVKETLDDAKRNYDANPEEAKKNLLMGWQESGIDKTDAQRMAIDKIAVTDATDKAVKAMSVAYIAEAIVLNHKYLARGTDTARALQIRFDPVDTPEGRRAWLIRSIMKPTKQDSDKINNAATSKDATVAMTQTAQKTIKVFEALQKKGIDIINMSEADLLDNAKVGDAMREISAIKATYGDVIHEWWRNSILSAPTTPLVNAVGNTANASLEALIQRPVEAAMNMFFKNADAATFSSVTAMLKAIAPTHAQAVKNFITSFRDETSVTGPKGNTLSKLDENNGAIATRFGGRIIRIPQRIMLATDEYFKTIFMAMLTTDYATREFDAMLKEGTVKESDRASYILDQMKQGSNAYKAAWGETLRWSFQEETGTFINAVMQSRNTKYFGFFFKFIFPFVKTPTNIIKTGIRKTPLGAIPYIIKMANGTMSSADKMRLGAEQVVSLVFMASLYAMMKGDDEDPLNRPRITGSRRTSYKSSKGQKEDEMKNRPPMSIRVGDKWISYARMEPFATVLSTMVDMLTAFDQAKDGKFDAMGDTIVSGIKGNFTDKTFLQGMSNIVRVMEGDPKARIDIPLNIAAGFNPNIARSLLRSADPYVRDSKMYGDKEDMPEKVMTKLARSAFPSEKIASIPKYGADGKPIEREGGTAYNYLVPFKMQSADKTTKVDAMISRWNESVDDDKKRFWNSTPEPIKAKVMGEEIQMTAEEYEEYQKLAGTKASEILSRQTFNYENPTARDIAKVKDIYSVSRNAAMAKIRHQMITRWRKEQGK